MTSTECQKLVAVLLGAYPQSRISASTPAVYERMLVDLDVTAANAAIERLLATAKFMPTIAEIREAALAVTVGEVKRGGEAWGEVQRLLARYGARRYDLGWKPPITDPVAVQVVAALGWVALCDSENQVADRARFIDLYDQLAARDRRSLTADHLPAAQKLRAASGHAQIAETSSIVAGLVRQIGGGS